MGQQTNYDRAQQLANIDARNIDGTERQLALAQIHATLALADQVYGLVNMVERLAIAAEGSRDELPSRIASSLEGLRQQIRANAGN